MSPRGRGCSGSKSRAVPERRSPGAAAAGSSPGTSGPGARPAGALSFRLERALHQSRREAGRGLFCFSSAKDQRPNKCSSVSDEAPSTPGVPWGGPGSDQVGLPGAVGTYVRRGKKSGMLN